MRNPQKRVIGPVRPWGEGEHEVPFLNREPQLHDSRWLLRAARNRNGGFYEQVVAWLIERRAVCTMQLSEMG